MNHMKKLEKRWAGKEPTEQMLNAAEAWDLVHRPVRVSNTVQAHVERLLAMNEVPEAQRDEFYWNERRLQFRRVENMKDKSLLRGKSDNSPIKPNRRARLAAVAQLRKAK